MSNDNLRAEASALLDAAPCVVTLPAGCGKTHLVGGVGLVAADRGNRLLVLTHTHAGVDTLRHRMREFGVVSSAAYIGTIDSWSQRLVHAFPCLAGYVKPEEVHWPEIHTAAIQLLTSAHVVGMLRVSYDFVIVDEYQDCTVLQHKVVMALARAMPTIVLGDPLQGIYDFGGNELVSWKRDLGHLPPSDLPLRPWRWQGHNEELGQFLSDVRNQLIEGKPIELANTPVAWVKDTPDNRRTTCWKKVGVKGSVVILDRFDQQCEATARSLRGHFGVMEELEGKKLLDVARAADEGGGLKFASAVVAFAFLSHAKLPPNLKQKGKVMGQGTFPTYKQGSAITPVLSRLESLSAKPCAEVLLAVLDEFEALGGTLFRKEAWYAMRRAARAWQDGSSTSLGEAVRLTHDRTRVLGRRSAAHSVSRTVLIKGQEFDECVVLGAHEFSVKELYVAMTRPRVSLTILSDSPSLNPAPPDSFDLDP